MEYITIGYGELSAKGFAKYVYILQGVIGWFLLTIFIVSLISQLLQ